MDDNRETTQICNGKLSHCSICKHVSSKAILYVCHSGHVLCEKCQDSPRKDCGDAISKHKKHKHGKCRNCKARKPDNTDLASGDCSHTRKVLSDNLIKTPKGKLSGNRNSDNEDRLQRKPAEVTFQYRNEYYHDSSSSISKPSYLASNIEPQNTIVPPLPRPIDCPVCAKMIAVNSIMLHFYFDHSKVPKINIRSKIPRHILLKATDFNIKTNCLTILLLEGDKDDMDAEFQANNQAVLLMGAKTASASKNMSQEEVKNKQIYENSQVESSTGQYFKDEDIIILWICKLIHREIFYEVTLTKDKKLSFSYTGEAKHIKDKQDVHSMYENADGLILRGKAVNRLVDGDGVFNVYICIQ